jgi:RNA polymerase sigma-70 factor (ECF subfamily)
MEPIVTAVSVAAEPRPAWLSGSSRAGGPKWGRPRVDYSPRESLELYSSSETAPGAAAWLAAIAQGDLAAFQRLYQRFAPALLSYVRRCCREAVLAEDVVQEVFVTVWQKAASYQPDRGDVASWLYTIARNKLIDHWRRAGGAGAPAAPADRGAFDFEKLPARADPRSDLLLTLRKVLAQVTPEQRTAIELAYFGGLTYEETAERLQLPLGTLKSRIRIGLKTMRTLLESGQRGPGTPPGA